MTRGPDRRVVVSGVSNPVHLIYIASYLRHLLAKGPIEVLMPTRGRIDLTDPRVRSLLPDEPGLEIRLSDEQVCPAELPLTYVAVGAPGLKPYARLVRANPRRRIHVVVTDEGLGTYGTWRTRRSAWGREGVPEPWRTVRSVAVATGARTLTTERWALYEQHGDGWRVVEEVAAEFRRRVGGGRSAGRHSRVVLLTQPWVEMGAVREQDYLAHVHELHDEVAASGYELVVRPHPKERVGRYAGMGELNRRHPAELDPQVLGARAVIGGPSTALLNLSAVHGVPAVRIQVPGRPDLNTAAGSAQRALLQHFLGPVVDDTPELIGRLGL